MYQAVRLCYPVLVLESFPYANLHSCSLNHLFLCFVQLVDEQRKYFKAVKDFQDECNKNDWLSAKLEQITRQQ